MNAFKKSPLSVALSVALVSFTITSQATEKSKELAVTKVQDSKASQYKIDKVSTHKVTTDLIDTPKTITVISGDLLDDQGVTSFADALRNVSGVSTFGAGEGGGGNITTNDKLTIRGFSANESIYIDGIRDLTSYSRDLFNYEQIEVSKGANSSIAGKGTSGGSVNLVTKRATTESALNTAKISIDEAQSVRGTLDSNILISKDTALRINAVLSDGGDVQDNGVENYQSQGLALSLAHNVSDKTTVVADLLVIKQDNTPMLGLPWVTSSVAEQTSLTEGAIDKSLWDNYYGVKSRDFEKANVTQATVKVEHELSDTSRLVSSTRFVTSDRQSTLSRPVFERYENDNGDRIYTDKVRVNYLQNTDEANELLVTQLDFITQLNTGEIKHNLVIGGEAYKESYEYFRFTDNTVLSSNTVDLVNPAMNVTYTGNIDRSAQPAKIEGKAVAIYALDTIEFNPNWLMTAGVRFEDFSADGSIYSRTSDRDAKGNRIYEIKNGVDASDSFVSYNASIAYKPDENTNYYLGYSNSQSPSLTTLKGSRYESRNNLEPEEATTLELGGKWELLDDRVIVSGALFITEKTVNDRDDDRVYFLAGKQKVTGLELSVNGELTDDLSIIASYTHQSSEVTEDFTTQSVGNGLSSSPKDTANVWLSYAPSDKLSIGGGATYSSGDIYWRKSTAYFDTGSTTLVNVMASYEVSDDLSLQLNINNLTDKEYITDYSAKGHFLPGAPRTIKIGASYKF